MRLSTDSDPKLVVRQPSRSWKNPYRKKVCVLSAFWEYNFFPVDYRTCISELTSFLFRFSESKDLERSFLYTTHIPRKSSKEKPVNCLVKWDTRKWIPEHTVYIKNHTLSALAVRCDKWYYHVLRTWFQIWVIEYTLKTKIFEIKVLSIVLNDRRRIECLYFWVSLRSFLLEIGRKSCAA